MIEDLIAGAIGGAAYTTIRKRKKAHQEAGKQTRLESWTGRQSEWNRLKRERNRRQWRAIGLFFRRGNAASHKTHKSAIPVERPIFERR